MFLKLFYINTVALPLPELEEGEVLAEVDENNPNDTPPCDNDPVDVILCLYSCFLGNFSRKERKCITEIVENELDVSLSQHDVSMTGQEGDGLAEVDEKDSNFTPVCEDVSA